MMTRKKRQPKKQAMRPDTSKRVPVSELMIKNDGGEDGGNRDGNGVLVINRIDGIAIVRWAEIFDIRARARQVSAAWGPVSSDQLD